jgi:mono/diheme cytochrome c family protein
MRIPILVQLLRMLLVLGLFCGAAAAQAQTGQAQRGEVFAAANCAQCHAIGRTGTSPLAAAPVFRDLHRRYPVSQLAEALAEGIMTGHSAMPEFQLNQAQIADLLAYLSTLER